MNEKNQSIAIMQPYFFPYLGYFSLIENTDHFIFFDTPQYIKKGWINRNRIIGCGTDPVFINVPICKAPQNTAIKDIRISNNEPWKEKLFGQLSIYKRRAPYYNDVISLIENIVASNNYGDSMSQLAIQSIVETCDFLGISINYDVFSEMDMHINASAPDEWALEISKELGYTRYVNPPGGLSFFDRQKYKSAGIQIDFLEQQLCPYIQKKGFFTEGLSIIDVMMFCSNDEIHDMLSKYNLL